MLAFPATMARANLSENPWPKQSVLKGHLKVVVPSISGPPLNPRHQFLTYSLAASWDINFVFCCDSSSYGVPPRLVLFFDYALSSECQSIGIPRFPRAQNREACASPPLLLGAVAREECFNEPQLFPSREALLTCVNFTCSSRPFYSTCLLAQKACLRHGRREGRLAALGVR